MTIGVDLGGTNIRAGIVNAGQVLNHKKEAFHTKGSLDETISKLKEFIRPLALPEVSGIGIGVPSVVDVEKGIVYNVANIPSWICVPLKDILEEEFKIPVRVSNDVNCFVLGEHQFGVLKGMKHVVGISSGTGLGSGIIINNELFNGANCGAGEIGLLHYLDHNVEYYASGNLFSACYNTTAEAAHQRALQGDREALGHWNEFGKHIAEAIKSVVFTYDPQAIVLGGSLSKAFDLFSGAMHTALMDFPYPGSIQKLKIFKSKDENITVVGAAALVDRRMSVTARVA